MGFFQGKKSRRGNGPGGEVSHYQSVSSIHFRRSGQTFLNSSLEAPGRECSPYLRKKVMRKITLTGASRSANINPRKKGKAWGDDYDFSLFSG